MIRRERAESREDVFELGNIIVEKASQYDGLDYFIVVHEGFPLVYTGSISREQVEAVAAAAVDFGVAGDLHSSDVAGDSEWRAITISYKDGKSLSISRSISHPMTFVAKGEKRLPEALVTVSSMYIDGKKVACYNCGRDLTLEPYQCPRCRRKSPLSTPTCPFCGADLRVKLCPYCKAPITFEGSKPTMTLAEATSDVGFVATEGLVGAAISGGLVAIITFNPLLAAVAAILGFAAGAAIAYRAARRSLSLAVRV